MSLFGDFHDHAPPAHELTYVPRYSEPRAIPAINNYVTIPWLQGIATVPTLDTIMRTRLVSMLGYTSRTLQSSRAYRSLQTGFSNDDGTGGLFATPDQLERELIEDATIRAGQFPGTIDEALIVPTAARERAIFELWIFDALNFIHQESDRGATICMPSTPPPPPGYVKPPITSGPGAMGLPK